jgi:hypothetical protein
MLNSTPKQRDNTVRKQSDVLINVNTLYRRISVNASFLFVTLLPKCHSHYPLPPNSTLISGTHIYQIPHNLLRNIFLQYNQQDAPVISNYSCKTLHMFRTVFPSIIRSSKLRIQQRYMSNSCCYLLLSGMKWNSIEFHLISDSSRYQQLFDIYSCCIRSFELLTMDGKTVRNMCSVLQE